MSLNRDIVITATCSKCKEETASIYSKSFRSPVKRAKKRRIGEGWFISKQVNLCPKCNREELDLEIAHVRAMADGSRTMRKNCPKCGHLMSEHDSRDNWCHHIVPNDPCECGCVGKSYPADLQPEPTCPECGHPISKHGDGMGLCCGSFDCRCKKLQADLWPNKKIIPDDVNNLPCDHDIDCQCGYCQPIKPEKHCNRCGGTGIVDSPSHWDAKRVMCPKCNGTGKANPTTPDFAKKCPECGHPIMTHNRYGCQARYPVCSCRIRRFELEHIPDTDYKKERASHKKPVKIEINSKVPSKWRLVDLETGDIWKWDEGNNTFMRATLK